MYISRIELYTQKLATRLALSSPQILHAAIERCFDREGGEKERKLWRLDRFRGKLYLVLLSPGLPDFTHFAAQFCEEGVSGEFKAYQPVLDGIKNGQRLRFRLRANPVHSVPIVHGERGKIFPQVTIAQKQAWLIKRSESCGFTLGEDDFTVVESRIMRFKRKERESRVELNIAVYEGELVVIDAARFVQALINGIGRAKAYGCGLITVARIM